MAATSLFSGQYANKGWKPLTAMIAFAALLYVCAGIGMAYVAGFDKVQHRLETAQWWWLGPSFAAVVLAFVGYYFAY